MEKFFIILEEPDKNTQQFYFIFSTYVRTLRPVAMALVYLSFVLPR
jgi:hypothetical protein